MQFGDIRKDGEEGEGGEVGWVHSCRANEVFEMRVVVEEVAKVENIGSALEMNVGDEQTESARTKVATCEGEAVQCLEWSPECPMILSRTSQGNNGGSIANES